MNHYFGFEGVQEFDELYDDRRIWLVEFNDYTHVIVLEAMNSRASNTLLMVKEEYINA